MALGTGLTSSVEGTRFAGHGAAVHASDQQRGGTRPVSTVEIAGRQLRLSNLDKVLYPAMGFTKAQVVDYYARIGPAMLPHLTDRAVTMVRWPNGVEGERFFEKRCPPHAPEWVRSAAYGDPDNPIIGCVVDELATLVWMANLAALELHTLQARVSSQHQPDSMVFDLDPGPGADILDCARVGIELRELLDDSSLQAVVKTSGSKGLHLAVPLHTKVTDDDTKHFARALGGLLATRDPKRVTVIMRREERRGKVFVDWSQNDRSKTTVCAYSLRGKARPTVSTPITWDEAADAIAAHDAQALSFETEDAIDRVERLGDLYAANLSVEQTLPTVPSGR
jgi:bifunctional non-homologous end joining protein LigD